MSLRRAALKSRLNALADFYSQELPPLVTSNPCLMLCYCGYY